MWFLEKYLNAIHGRCADIEDEVAKLKREVISPSDLAVCEICGCLLWKCTAAKGISEVRRKGWYPTWLGCTDDEYIYHPYYCKIHAPKEEEKEENKSLDK